MIFLCQTKWCGECRNRWKKLWKISYVLINQTQSNWVDNKFPAKHIHISRGNSLRIILSLYCQLVESKKKQTMANTKFDVFVWDECVCLVGFFLYGLPVILGCCVGCLAHTPVQWFTFFLLHRRYEDKQINNNNYTKKKKTYNMNCLVAPTGKCWLTDWLVVLFWPSVHPSIHPQSSLQWVQT